MDDSAPGVTSQDPSNFSSLFCVPRRVAALNPAGLSTPCEWCCHWTLPLLQTPRETSAGPVALSYTEWLVWHWHVLHHQGGVPLI